MKKVASLFVAVALTASVCVADATSASADGFALSVGRGRGLSLSTFPSDRYGGYRGYVPSYRGSLYRGGSPFSSPRYGYVPSYQRYRSYRPSYSPYLPRGLDHSPSVVPRGGSYHVVPRRYRYR